MNLAISDTTAISPSNVFLDGESITERDLFAQCDALITELNESGDQSKVEGTIKNLIGIQSFSGKALCRLVYQHSKWYKEHFPEVNYYEHFTEIFGGKPLTVQKHELVGEFLEREDVPDSAKGRNVAEIVPMARALNGGYDLSDFWSELQTASGESEINDIIREVKGKPPRKGSLTIYLEPSGDLVGWKDNQRFVVGWLNLQDAQDSPEIEKAISRIVDNSKIKRN